MQIFSHLVIAQKMLSHLTPDNLPEYYWGAVVADVRYFAGLRRRVTHPRLEEVRAWQEEYPALNSFVLGYRVHTLADERDAVGSLYDFIPWQGARRRLPRKWAANFLEMVYIERCRFDGIISGAYNPLLERLGVTQVVASTYATAVMRYTAEPTLEVAARLLAEFGGTSSPRLRQALAMAGWLQRFPWIRRILIGLIDEPTITRRVVADLWSHF